VHHDSEVWLATQKKGSYILSDVHDTHKAEFTERGNGEEQ